MKLSLFLIISDLTFVPCVLSVQGGAVVQNSGPDPFEVSDADTMLKYLTSK